MKKLLLIGIPVLILVLAAVLLIAVLRGGMPSQEPFEDRFRKGIGYSPKSLTSSSDVTDFWEKAKEAGGVVRTGGDWIDFHQNGKISSVVAELTERYGLVPVIEVNFFNQDSGTLLRPLNDANKQVYKIAAVEFAQEYKPPYFGIGVEIDTWYRADPSQFDSFASLFTEVYDAVKTASPNTKVFTTFQYERLQGLAGGIFGGTDDTSKNNWALLEKFPKADFLAFTTYPGLIYKDPADIPSDYYSKISGYTSKPVVFNEIGWFSGSGISGWESSEGEQVRFITRFFELTATLDMKLAIWLHMYPLVSSEPFATMSLFNDDGTAKSAWGTWVSAAR